jgi:hypothetical protein
MTPPVSPTFTGPLPELTINLDICEIGDPCRPAIAVPDNAMVLPPRGTPAYVCRIHRVRAFLVALGWLERK